LAQKAYDTHESSERAALKELLSTRPRPFQRCKTRGPIALI